MTRESLLKEGKDSGYITITVVIIIFFKKNPVSVEDITSHPLRITSKLIRKI